MNLKYFIRGLGVGIVFGTLIMLVAYMTSGGYKLSDEEVIKKAEKLGMVMEESPVPELEDTEEQTTESDLEDTTVESAFTTTTEQPKEDTEQSVTEEEVVTTEEQTTEDVTTEEKTTEKPSGDYITATIEVVSGMGSYEIAKLLEDADIIEDAADFDAYLNSNGYSTKLEIDTYTFSSDMTYEEIAKALIKAD